MELSEKILEYQSGDPKGKTHVVYRLYRFGRDLVLMISGGDAHIGSVACSDKESTSNHHQFTLTKHKEDELVKEALDELKDVVPGEILVVGGIHNDRITQRQMKQITGDCRKLVQEIKQHLLRNIK
ncbi:MAG: hypothetical protein GY866_42665 [Proteobacteria bacterium]|nr:hypothetical protein [Pseudomonadota bacterium]